MKTSQGEVMSGFEGRKRGKAYLSRLIDLDNVWDGYNEMYVLSEQAAIC